jgi:hypothetical protein
VCTSEASTGFFRFRRAWHPKRSGTSLDGDRQALFQRLKRLPSKGIFNPSDVLRTATRWRRFHECAAMVSDDPGEDIWALKRSDGQTFAR